MNSVAGVRRMPVSLEVVWIWVRSGEKGPGLAVGYIDCWESHSASPGASLWRLMDPLRLCVGTVNVSERMWRQLPGQGLGALAVGCRTRPRRGRHFGDWCTVS